MTTYLHLRAAAYRLLVDSSAVSAVEEARPADETVVDLSRALGGGSAATVIACEAEGRETLRLGVDAAVSLVILDEDDFAALPDLIAATAGQDIDAVTRAPLDGAHAFRLRLL